MIDNTVRLFELDDFIKFIGKSIRDLEKIIKSESLKVVEEGLGEKKQ